MVISRKKQPPVLIPYDIILKGDAQIKQKFSGAM
jgi:hypothetical protein